MPNWLGGMLTGFVYLGTHHIMGMPIENVILFSLGYIAYTVSK